MTTKVADATDVVLRFAHAAGRLREGSASHSAAMTMPTRAAAPHSVAPAAPETAPGQIDRIRATPRRPSARQPTSGRLTVVLEFCITYEIMAT